MKAQFIRAWREHRGMTQLVVANGMGISRSYFTMIERGDRRYDQHFLEAAAKVLDCQPADLIARPPGTTQRIIAMLDALTEQEYTRVTAIVRELCAASLPDAELVQLG